MSGEPKLIMVADDGGETLEFAQLKNGLRQPHFNKTANEIQEIFEHVPETPCRDDDIMLATFAKTGTNWLYEILSMVQRRSAARVQETKMSTMLEANPADVIDSRPSPRVLNTHYRPSCLPKDMARKKVKTVLCLRNPKDTAVSYFAHMTAMRIYNYTGKFTDWIGPFVQGELEYNSYADYLNEWQQAIEAGLGYPLHVMYFENLKMDGMSELNKLLEFLEVDLDEATRAAILAQCDFRNMRKDKPEIVPSVQHFKNSNLFREGHSFYRKGEVGDWKNWFTVAKSEMFDAVWTSQIRPDTMFHFW
ncbi:sulfotransferase 1B1-like [Mya arenaria]|uniref:sulfotransferase 1B1-like n=1 Tax=Mya arenaria TaxID=6604 RepID=UPI0022E8A8B5|nr:sulfotransferase 1B1-like [Mya arenaria]